MLRFWVLSGLSGISMALGGWDYALQILVVCIVVDYSSGVIGAGVNGKLCCKVGLNGIYRKVSFLLLVVLSVQMDSFFGIDKIHDMVVYFLTFNEMISIVKNLDLIGVPVPSVVKSMLRGADDGSTKDL